jgi:hypothetical protein
MSDKFPLPAARLSRLVSIRATIHAADPRRKKEWRRSD